MFDRQPDPPAPIPLAPLRLKVTSDTATLAAVRRQVESYAAAAGFDETAIAEIGLVVNEAMANIIRHAYHGQTNRPVAIEAEVVAGEQQVPELQLRLRDWGNAVNPECVPVRGYVPGQPGGLGLVCLKQMMDSVQYAPQPDGMLLTMSRRIRRTGDAHE